MIKIPNQEFYQHHKESLETYEETKHLRVFNITESRAIAVREALLKYRRENNIFEVGDCYVYLSEWDDDLNNIFKFDELEWGDYLWNIERMIRHATPSEIKAGHRL